MCARACTRVRAYVECFIVTGSGETVRKSQPVTEPLTSQLRYAIDILYV